jgi:hypothetical protein
MFYLDLQSGQDKILRAKRLFTLACLLFVGWTSYEIWSWGRPVPLRTRMLGREGANGGKKVRWLLDNNQDGKADITQGDTNGDGRVDQLEFGAPAVRVIDLDSLESRGSGRRKLAVCLDGVPFAQMAELWDEGYFREFSRPTRMISTFPSLSDVALTSVMNAGKVPGYENLYFDVRQNRLGGGPFSTLSKARIPYLEILDYDEPGIFKGMAYILPDKTFRADLGRFLKKYQISRELRFTSHLCSTDALCHVRSRAEFRPYLLEVDALLREIFMSCLGQLDFIVFSDHGNSQVDSHQVDIQLLLKRHGFQLESSLNDEKSVVVPAFGLVGAIAVYCHPSDSPRLAEILAYSEGVDFCVYAEGGAARIVSSQGIASINKDTSGKLQFVNETGDFLQMSAILLEMKTNGQLDSNGFAPASVWFQATADHVYPNAVNALYEAVTNHVLNPANVLVSLKDGYHYGSTFFNRLVTLRSTHGSLYTTQMTGFVMRNGPPQVRTIDSHEVLSTF